MIDNQGSCFFYNVCQVKQKNVEVYWFDGYLFFVLLGRFMFIGGFWGGVIGKIVVSVIFVNIVGV